MSTPGPPAPCTLDEPFGCCPSPPTVVFTEQWRNDDGDFGGCCNYDYTATLSLTTDDPAQSIWTGSYSGIDGCGNSQTLPFTLTLDKMTGFATAERAGAGSSFKSGIYGSYPPLVFPPGTCGNVVITYVVS